ncbi:MAG TPA: DUF998 domain-containing protein, partial [Candidatus Lokiarchaeia archaeon]
VIIAFSLYIALLVIAVIIAFLFGPESFNIWLHNISDLGSIRYSPAPYLYDLAGIIAGIFTIPFSFYMEKILAPIPEKKDISSFSRLRFRLGSYAFLFSIIGNIGYIMVGIFSEDRNYFGLHNISSVLAFAGFVLGAFFMGWLIVLYDTKIPKIIGIYGILGPFSMSLVYLVVLFNFIQLEPFFEWILLFAVLGWLIPLIITLFRKK